MSLAAASAPVRDHVERGPSALLPAWVARLAGFAALACLGVTQWQRMIDGVPAGRPLLWVLLAVLASGAVLACERLPERWRPYAMIGAALAGLLAAYLAAGLELGLLRPRRLDELGSGLISGSQALSTVRLPYEGADPWPAHVLQLLGSGLVMIAGLLALWPRVNGTRGYPFLSLAVLLVLTASPVVSMGGTRPLLLGAALTVLTVCFLWLERLPLRPGLGVAALVGLALAGALPLASAADRGEPWFDYQAFAEGLGPKDPVRFDWGHSGYGPITWTRTGAEVVRIKAARPSYWKVRTLDTFDGSGWGNGGLDQADDDPGLDLPANVQRRFEDRIQVSVQRMRGSDVVGAGTTVAIEDESRRIVPGDGPGQWQSVGDLRTGDSYVASVYVPKPTTDQLAAVEPSADTEHMEDLDVRMHLRDLAPAEVDALPSDVPRTPLDQRLPAFANIEFPPFGREGARPVANYRTFGLEGDGETAIRISTLSRTYSLAQRLKAAATTPYEYALAVNDYLREGFKYTEKPPRAPVGVEPLEYFLLDSKAGYCQHFSAGMALLLRMGGVPARVATGFSPGGYSKRKQAWIVRDTDAHSWVEAWFEGYGWVTLDPTPSQTPARSQIASLAAPTTAEGGSADNPAGDPDAGGTTPADRRAAGSREELFNQLRGGNAGGTATEDDGGGAGSVAPLWLLIPIALLLGAGGALWAVRRRRERPDDPLERAIYELETALRRSGRPTPVGMTLRQLEARLGLSGDAAGYLRAVSAARYAPRPVQPTAEQRRALRRELASGQGLAGRVRTFWALPPRAPSPTGRTGRRRRTGR